jgi:hypothetical protein
MKRRIVTLIDFSPSSAEMGSGDASPFDTHDADALQFPELLFREEVMTNSGETRVSALRSMPISIHIIFSPAK